jgi:DNA-binding GntR family transcriptional regulator
LKSGRIQESLEEHRALMQAISARDAPAAMDRMQQHFKNGLNAAA